MCSRGCFTPHPEVFIHAQTRSSRHQRVWASQLAEHADASRRIVITDGVFSMEGDLAPLPGIVDLVRRYDAILVLDDSHGLGVMGERGRGTAEHFGLHGEIDIVTGTLGKALGGAAGGFVAGSRSLCSVLEQQAPPGLFSNALPPTVACSARAALDRLRTDPALVRRLRDVAGQLRSGLQDRGLVPFPSESGIVAVLVGETRRAIRISERLEREFGLLATGFGHPVVPEGTARIRLQASAAMDDVTVAYIVDAVATALLDDTDYQQSGPAATLGVAEHLTSGVAPVGARDTTTRVGAGTAEVEPDQRRAVLRPAAHRPHE